MSTKKFYRECTSWRAIVPNGILGILKGEEFIVADMQFDGKSLVNAYKRFVEAIRQAVDAEALPEKFVELVQTADRGDGRIAEADILKVFSAQTDELSFELDDNTDIGNGFYLKCAVSYMAFNANRAKSARAESQALVSAETSREVTQVEESFEESIEFWLRYLSEGRGGRNALPRTIANYRGSLKLFREWLDRHGVDGSAVGKETILAWIADMRKRGLKERSVNAYLSAVKNFYIWRAKRRGEEKNFASEIESFPIPKEHARGTLTPPKMRQLLVAVGVVAQKKICAAKYEWQRQMFELQKLRDLAILVTMLTGACRTIEISRLTVGDFDDDDPPQLFLWGKGKTESQKAAIRISLQTAQIIRQWLRAREEVGTVSNGSPLFCSVSNRTFGQSISSTSISRLCKNYLQAAGLKEISVGRGGEKKAKPVSAHSLRASCATAALRGGARVDEVQQLLRHARLSTTSIYVSEIEAETNPSSDIVSTALWGAPPKKKKPHNLPRCRRGRPVRRAKNISR